MQYILIAVLAGFAASFNLSIDEPANQIAGFVCVVLGFLSLIIGIVRLGSKRY